jgi:hypothetical protein
MINYTLKNGWMIICHLLNQLLILFSIFSKPINESYLPEWLAVIAILFSILFVLGKGDLGLSKRKILSLYQCNIPLFLACACMSLIMFLVRLTNADLLDAPLEMFAISISSIILGLLFNYFYDRQDEQQPTLPPSRD